MCTSCGCMSATRLSRIEWIKEASDHLRGSIARELTLEEPVFSEDPSQILKFHCIYQQEDRDRRRQARQQHGQRLHVMMVRTRVSGGQVPPEMYLAHDDIAAGGATAPCALPAGRTSRCMGCSRRRLGRSTRRC